MTPNYENVYPEDITKYIDPVSWEAHFGESYFVTITGDKTNGYKVTLNHSTEEDILMENEKEKLEEEKMEEPGSASIEADTEGSAGSIVIEPEIVDADWSEYFNGLNGTAVVYDAVNRRYTMYNGDVASTRRSPCSTFKIDYFFSDCSGEWNP